MTRFASSGVFNRFDLAEDLERPAASALSAVDNIDADALLAPPTSYHVELLFVEHGAEPPKILWDEAEQLVTEECQVERSSEFLFNNPNFRGSVKVPASRITVAVPVVGEGRFLGGRAHSFLAKAWPATKLTDSELRIWSAWPNPSAEAVARWWKATEDELRRHTEPITHDVSVWQEQLPGLLTRCVEARRQRLLRDRGLEGAMGLRVRTRDARPVPVPVVRKRIATTRAQRQRGVTSNHREPELDAKAYAEILDIICGYTRSLERSPRVAQKYDEEELRDQILMHLNGHFEGEAAGELFNGAGKTDILIRHCDRNVFIGECKFWEGQKAFTDAIDQLNGYLLFRDTKAAILVFIKRKDATAIVEKAIAAIRAHPQFKRDGEAAQDPLTLSHYVMRHHDDDHREIRLAMIPVVIRSEEPSAAEVQDVFHAQDIPTGRSVPSRKRRSGSS